MLDKKLKYLGYDIVFQEIPNEITLAINISGCPNRCNGCHSEYLWNYEGAYISDDIDVLLDKYGGYISCVCFMGGDQNQKELKYLLSIIKIRGIKTALYSGNDKLDNICSDIIGQLDYIKIGRYIEELGGLDKETTNQVLYKIKSGEFIDITDQMRPI